MWPGLAYLGRGKMGRGLSSARAASGRKREAKGHPFDPKGAVRPLAIGHWPTIDTGPRNPQARRSRTRSRSLARLAQLAARPCCRLVVVVVLRTPPAELSDAAVRPDQRYASISPRARRRSARRGWHGAQKRPCSGFSGLWCRAVEPEIFFRDWLHRICGSISARISYLFFEAVRWPARGFPHR